MYVAIDASTAREISMQQNVTENCEFFLTPPTLHAVTHNQHFGVTRAMLLLPQVLKFLLLLVLYSKLSENQTVANKHNKDHQRDDDNGWHSM